MTPKGKSFGRPKGSRDSRAAGKRHQGCLARPVALRRASPEVRLHGPHAAYRKVEGIARKVPGSTEIFAAGDLTVIKDNDPLVVLLRKAISTGPGVSGIRFTNNSRRLAQIQ